MTLSVQVITNSQKFTDWRGWMPPWVCPLLCPLPVLPWPGHCELPKIRSRERVAVSLSCADHHKFPKIHRQERVAVALLFRSL